MIKLNLGSGFRLFPGYINVDIIPAAKIEPSSQPDTQYVEADIRKLPFEDNYADQVEMFSVIEHFPFREVEDVLKEVYRVLKPSGKLIIITDDFDGIVLDWLNMRMTQFSDPQEQLQSYQHVMETVYGNQNHEGEFHKVCMTPDFLNWALSRAGFEKGEITKLPKNYPIKVVGGMFKPAPDMVYRNTQILVEAEK